jgi:hypothetical protein
MEVQKKDCIYFANIINTNIVKKFHTFKDLIAQWTWRLQSNSLHVFLPHPCQNALVLLRHWFGPISVIRKNFLMTSLVPFYFWSVINICMVNKENYSGCVTIWFRSSVLQKCGDAFQALTACVRCSSQQLQSLNLSSLLDFFTFVVHGLYNTYYSIFDFLK